MDKEKFLGACLLIAALLVSGAIIWHAQSTNDVGRYQFHVWNLPGNASQLVVIDTKTGEVKSNDGIVLMPSATEKK